MNRYIDADALLKELQKKVSIDSPFLNEVENRCVNVGLEIAMKNVKGFPTTDVAPRAEIVAEIFEEIKNCLMEYFDVKSDQYRTMQIKTQKELQIATADYQGAVNAVLFALNCAVDIKEKYTEGVVKK